MTAGSTSAATSSGVVEGLRSRGRPVSRRGLRGTWTSWFPLVLIALVGATITWFRVPGDHRDRVWAEDGTEFLLDAVERGPWSVLFQGYTGYQQFFPRVVVGAIWPFFDIVWYPVTVFAICSVLTGLAAAAVFWLARDLVPSLLPRLVLSAITVLIPLATQEVIGNLADLHTYAMWLAPWLLLYRPRTWWTAIAWAVLAFALVMTEIQTVFFIFLIFFGLRRANRTAWPMFAAFGIGAVAQIVTSLTDERVSGEGVLSIPSTVMGWMINSVMPLVTADPSTIRAWVLDTGLLSASVILLPIIAAAVVTLVWGTGRQRLLAVALLLGSAAVYTGSAWANSAPWFRYAELGLGAIDTLMVNSRYGVASGLLLVAVVPLGAAVLLRRWKGSRWSPWAAGASCILTVAVLAFGTTTAVSVRDQGERWSPAARAAVVQCAEADAPVSVELPVSPHRFVEIPCEDTLALDR